jgi:phage gp16-like protein
MTALAKLHIAKKELALHDDDYRAILERVTGQRSAKGMSEADIVRVLDVLKKDHGWVPTVVQGGKKAGKPESQKAKPAEHPTARKARAMWISLWQLGAVRERAESALEAFAKRQLKVERLVWADEQQMFKLIEALKAMATRAGWDQDLTEVKPGAQLYTLKLRLVRAQFAKLRKDIPANVWRYDTTLLTTLAADLAVLIHIEQAEAK